MPVAAVLAGTVHQPLDLALGEVASFNCQVYDGWCTFLGCRFHADKPCLRATYCFAYTPCLHSHGNRGSASDRDAGWRRRGPQGGLFSFKFSSRRHPRKFALKLFLAVMQVAGAEVGWPVFGLPPLGKIIGSLARHLVSHPSLGAGPRHDARPLGK